MKKSVKKPKLGTGARFKALSSSVAKSYEKKGMSPKKAKAISGAVAAIAGRAKYGTLKMNKMATAGKKRRAKKSGDY